MAKKRGLAANRGLDALLGSIKKEKSITAAALRDDIVEDSENLDYIKSNANKSKNLSNINSSKAPLNSKSNKKQSAKSQLASNVVNNENIRVHKFESPATEGEMSFVQIRIECLQAGKYQPRRDMSETALKELASSISQHGVMQPIVIRPLLDSEDKADDIITHEIIAGERRWRAARMAGETTIPAIERVLSDELAIALALIENIQREDLSVIEQAAALQRFHTEFGMSHAMIADVVGKARTTVSNLLRLNHLNEIVKTYLNDGKLDMGHARTLLSLSSEQQPIIADKIIKESMTVREAEKLVKSILNPQAQDKDTNSSNADIEKLNQQLSDQLGSVVRLKQKRSGKGSMEIFFHSPDELEALIAYFKK